MCNKIKQIYKGFSTCGFDSFFWRVTLAQPFTIPDSTLEHFWLLARFASGPVRSVGMRGQG